MLRSIVLLSALVLAVPAFASEGPASTEPMHPHGPAGGWHHSGVFGSYDRGALQRGFAVYKQVCSACHSLNLVAYRNLADLGYNEAEIKSIAGEKTVMDGPDDEGKMFERPARPSDRFVAPFANDNAARFANNGALPPDLSLITKARHDGENYVYSLLLGYKPAPEDVKLLPGMNYNPYFPGHQIGMPEPLSGDDMVAYSDGTKATKEQMAKDVTTFLAWAAEPHMEQRKRVGIRVMLFLLVLTAVFYAAKRQLWRDLH